ncbi:hypothetical protein WN943_003171 [Citrus x changshan-huyou]|uniref:Uncharacterized protein n=1 Tax=Citrus sinensis TaxID=2711 RepID=A0A067D5R3_CITSI|nr:hypothetical protein CISIN_1g047887mg [Citrus sinensis]
MALAKQLSLISQGSQPVVESLADKLVLIGAPVPDQYLTTHTLNRVGPQFKELATAVRAREIMISFDELHNKLGKYEAFLKREELCSTENLRNIITNITCFSSSKNGNQFDAKNFQNNKGSQGQRPTNSGNQGSTFNPNNIGNTNLSKNTKTNL